MLFFLLDQTSHIAGVIKSNNFVLSANGDFLLMFDSVRVLKCIMFPLQRVKVRYCFEKSRIVSVFVCK